MPSAALGNFFSRPHAETRPERRQQAVMHRAATGRWGLGKATPKGSADAHELASGSKGKGGKGKWWGGGQQKGRQGKGEQW